MSGKIPKTDCIVTKDISKLSKAQKKDSASSKKKFGKIPSADKKVMNDISKLKKDQSADNKWAKKH